MYVAPSTVNVAARHLLKNLVAKPTAEFLRLEETRRMGESGHDDDLFSDAATVDVTPVPYGAVVGRDTCV